MKLITQLKLCPTPEQADAIRRTLEAANAACNAISQVAWDHQQFGKYQLQQLTYYAVRETYGLAAQLAIRCLAKVADSYKLNRNTKRAYRPHGSVAYDDRILTYYTTHHSVSIWTIVGRMVVPFQAGDYHEKLLANRRGETDLVFRRGTFYLLATCEVDEPPMAETPDAIGVDLGIVNVAADSDGAIHTGEQIERVR